MNSTEILNMTESYLNISDVMNDTDYNDVLSATVFNSTVTTAKIGKLSIAFKVVYAIGILGNAAAIVALRTGKRRVKNRKHLLLLTSLAANDLVALVSLRKQIKVK